MPVESALASTARVLNHPPSRILKYPPGDSVLMSLSSSVAYQNTVNADSNQRPPGVTKRIDTSSTASLGP